MDEYRWRVVTMWGCDHALAEDFRTTQGVALSLTRTTLSSTHCGQEVTSLWVVKLNDQGIPQTRK